MFQKVRDWEFRYELLDMLLLHKGEFSSTLLPYTSLRPHNHFEVLIIYRGHKGVNILTSYAEILVSMEWLLGYTLTFSFLKKPVLSVIPFKVKADLQVHLKVAV